MVAAGPADLTALQSFAHRPVARRALIETRDPLVVSEQFSREFAPHRIEVTNRPRHFLTIAHKASMGDATLYQVASASDVRITTGPVGNFYLFYIPLAGRIEIQRAAGTVQVAPGEIGIINPGDRYSLAKLGNCTQIALKFARSALVRQAAEMSGRQNSPHIAFETSRAVSFRTCPMLLRLVDMFHANLAGLDDALEDPLCKAPAETLLARLILRSLPSNLDLPAGDGNMATSPAPYYVVRAERAIAAHARGTLTMEELVSVSGVSARSLFSGFREFRGTSPMRRLREVRLDRVHEELVGMSRHQGKRRTVTSVAGEWGFNHMGSFSAAYRERFGELPSDTLLRTS